MTTPSTGVKRSREEAFNNPFNEKRPKVEAFPLPLELIRQIISLVNVWPGEAKGLLQTSKAVRQMAIETYRWSLKGFVGVNSDDQAIAFFREYGAHLNFINLQMFPFSENKLATFFQFLPTLNTLHLSIRPGFAKKVAEAATLTRLERLYLSTMSDVKDADAETIAQSPHLINLKSLTMKSFLGLGFLTTRVRSGIAEAFAHSQTLTSLRILDLEENAIDDEGAVAIAQSQTLANLQELKLNRTSVGSRGAAALATSQTLTNLQKLHLSITPVGDEGAIAMAQSRTLTTLRFLDLMSAGIGDAGAIAIANSQTLPHLEDLSLGKNLGDPGVIAIAHSSTIKKLQRLCFQGKNIGDKGAQAVAQSLTLANLSYLSFQDTSLGDMGAKAIVSLGNLQTLILDSNKIGNGGFAALSGIKSLKELHFLQYDVNEITVDQPLPNLQILKLLCTIGDAGAAALARSPHLQNLHTLELGACQIGDVGAAALAESKTLQNIRILFLGTNKIGDVGAKALAQSKTLQNLQNLTLFRNPIGEMGVIALAHSPTLRDVREFNIAMNLTPKVIQALKQREKIGQLYTLQREKLYRDVAEASRLQGIAVTEPLEEWGNEHLFDDPEILKRALGNVKLYF